MDATQKRPRYGYLLQFLIVLWELTSGSRRGFSAWFPRSLEKTFPLFAAFIITINSLGAADYRTSNFIVQAPSKTLAYQVATAAESLRRDLAIYWVGRPLAEWPNPCPIRVISGPDLPAQGVTTYNPVPARDFQMEVVGTSERILDSVLPHEITHTVLATYFRRPLPRWADEGICTTMEHHSERAKHDKKLIQFLKSHRGIAMNQLFLMKEYPSDVLPMYAQGYSVCQFLIDQKGPRAFIAFLGDYLKQPSWTANINKHYGYESLQQFQDYWIAWVASGSGATGAFTKLTRKGQTQSPQIAQVSVYGVASKNTGSQALPKQSNSNSFPNHLDIRGNSTKGLQRITGTGQTPLRPAPQTATEAITPKKMAEGQRKAAPSEHAINERPDEKPSMKMPPSDRDSLGLASQSRDSQSRDSQGLMTPNLLPITRLVPITGTLEGANTASKSDTRALKSDHRAPQNKPLLRTMSQRRTDIIRQPATDSQASPPPHSRSSTGSRPWPQPFSSSMPENGQMWR